MQPFCCALGSCAGAAEAGRRLRTCAEPADRQLLRPAATPQRGRDEGHLDRPATPRADRRCCAGDFRAQRHDAPRCVVFRIRAQARALPAVPPRAPALPCRHPTLAVDGDRRAGARAAEARHGRLPRHPRCGPLRRRARHLPFRRRVALVAGSDRLLRPDDRFHGKRAAARAVAIGPRGALRRGGLAFSRPVARRLQRLDLARIGGARGLRPAGADAPVINDFLRGF